MDDNAGEDAPPIFEDVFFSIIPSDDFSSASQEETRNVLLQNGGTEIPLRGSRRLQRDLKEITHIIATSCDFEDYDTAFDLFINIVKPKWVTDSVHKNKATNPRQYSPDSAMIFSDVVATCVGLPDGDIEAIRGLLLGSGGIFSAKISKMVTHIVALDMDNEVVQFAVRKNLPCKIVLPHWFDDCLKLRKRINEAPYQLPDPTILRANYDKTDFDPLQERPNYNQIKDALEPHPSSPVHRRKDLSVFKDMKIMFSADLDLSDHVLQTLKDLVQRSGGQVVNILQHATTLICRFREGTDFASAYMQRKEIGNLSWFYYLATYNKWTSPLKRLLHYPIPQNGIPGFEDTEISITIYTGEARIYLENLVHAAGGKFTKALRENNTHLIAAHTNSEKCQAAYDWNEVNVVNHMWLEESYAASRMMPVSNPRYTTFPARTNLGEVIGQTPIDMKELDKLFRSSHLQEDSPVMDIDGGPDADKATPGNKTRASRKQTLKSRKDGLQTPAASRFIEGKENETPGTSGSRGAKQRAISSLQDAAKDIEQYQKESKRVGGVTHGRPRSRDGAEALSKKRSTPDPATDDEAEEGNAEAQRRAKRSKIGSKLPKIAERLMVTKYQKWLDKPELEPKDRNKLRNLGIHITENPAECTVLCAPKIVRTRKFVSALAAAPLVVNTEWLDTCLRNNRVPKEGTHVLQDRDEEDRLGFRLDESLERAEKNKGKLLRGWQIFCTENVPGGWEIFKTIIEANGGVCSLYRGRVAMNASKRTFSRETQEDQAIADHQGEDEGDTLYLISSDGKKDRDLWEKFRNLAKKEDMVPKIVTSDWLLQVTMSQKVEPAGKWEHPPEGNDDTVVVGSSKGAGRRR